MEEVISNGIKCNVVQPVINEGDESKNANDFYVVGIGASAGGLEALEFFFTSMPINSNMAFVVIQHLSPDFNSLMPEILSRNTQMKVYQIQDGMKILPGCVYLNPPKFTVSISKGQLFLNEQNPNHRVNLTINAFLESLAGDMSEKSIGIILSGTGSDGTRGCRSIKEAGGIVLAQDVNTAKFNGMPKSVISTNICDFILAPAKMPEKLLRYTGQTSLITVFEDEDERTNEGKDTLSLVFDLIKNQFSTDFSLYKQSTVFRCLDRRLRICQIPTLEEYYTYLNTNLEEIELLYNSLLIGVTSFFRDRDAFDIIKNRVIPEIINKKTGDSLIRVWVAGCSTGEEAYSLAILFKEYMDISQRNINLKIFATDLDINAIDFASNGVYPDSITNEVSLEYLNRFFIKKRDGYHVSKHIRDMIIFSCHNVTNNPPFHKIDLLTCRNLLIYFQPNLQDRIISTFQFALEPNGFMFLGSSETTGELNKYFSTYDSKWRIFKKKDIKRRPLVNDFSIISTGMNIVSSKRTEDYFSRMERSKLEMEDIYTTLIERCLPPSVLIDEHGELIQICGDVDKYLKIPRGKMHYDIQKMVPNEISTALGTAINKVRIEKSIVTYSNIKIDFGENQININLIVKPLITKKSGELILVIFEENKKNNSNKEDNIVNFDTISELNSRITDLEQELQYTKESLQTSIEEIETSSEELQSSNEELLVSNEEMHSTNEELQSVNEELMVVNTQYQYKIQELADLNNDITNLLNSTTIGTLFLDSNLCVRKFTPAITKVVNLMNQDIGRPISHISHNLKNEDFVKESLLVMESLIPIEKEIQSSNDEWYILKYSPFRTNENFIKGIVLSLVDITARKEAEEDQRKSKELLNEAIAIDELKNDFFSNLSHELRTPLNVIMSSLQLLDSQKNIDTNTITDEYGKYCRIMKQNCYRQLRLVNNMIDSTKIDSGFFEINLHNHNIVSIVEEITLSVSDYIKNKGIKLVFDTDVEEKITAIDMDVIERIVLNLLSNAIKFTNDGGIISVNIYDKGETILISVKDNGIGIPIDKHKFIFERFRQVDKSLTRNHEGSGIGLSLVKSLLEMHDGKISFKSEPNKGTEFFIEIPIRLVPDDVTIEKDDILKQNNVEKIHIEFADIYNF